MSFGIYPYHLRNYIIRSALDPFGLWSKAAENLLIGTCAQESKLGYYVKQISGPALGIYQIEPDTFFDIINIVVPRAKKHFPTLIDYEFSNNPDNMIFDLRLATIMCRLQYWRWPEKLPAADDTKALAEYWKKYYNTINGKGTVDEFISNYQLTQY